MDNSNSFATPGRISHQIVHITPSSRHQNKRKDAPGDSCSNTKTARSSVYGSGVAPPLYKTTSVTDNILDGIKQESEGDPFVNKTYDEKEINVKKLSPTATPFKPRRLVYLPPGAVRQAIEATPSDRIFETPSDSSWASAKTSKVFETPGAHHTAEGIFDYVYPAGEFGSGRHTRYLSITGVPEHLDMNSIRVLIKGKTYREPLAAVQSGRSTRLIFLAFSNIVDSVNAAGEIPNKHSTWSLDFIDARTFSEAVVPGSGMYSSIHKGQLSITATRYGPRSEFSEREIVESLSDIMKNHGTVLAWEITSVGYPTVHVRMEYHDMYDAERAKLFLNGSVIGSLQLYVSDYAPDVQLQPMPVKADSLVTIGTKEDDMNTMVDVLTYDKMGSNNSTYTKFPSGYFNTPRSGLSSASGRTAATHGYQPSTTRFIMKSTPHSASLTPYSTGPASYSTGPTPYSSGPTPYSTGSAPFPTGSGPLSSVSAPYSSGLVPYATGTASYSSGLPAPNRLALVPRNGSKPYGFSSMPYHSTESSMMLYHNKRPAKINFLGGNNVVNPYRITQGQDVRTTIMLRNIPNKMPQAELKQFIDETNHGEYDFMYLRIDFANNCNVGYAFINFVDPLAIVKFVKARAGAKWVNWHSDKVAEISYATIQGKDCLIQKFRNSSVMLEDPSFRPKLFYVGNGPMAGKEEPFPQPDNDSKLRRSIENAGAVGLFAPRAGQYFRESQRRRRSQFDRGTHLAQIEESSFIGSASHSRGNMGALPGGVQSAPAHRMMF